LPYPKSPSAGTPAGHRAPGDPAGIRSDLARIRSDPARIRGDPARIRGDPVSPRLDTACHDRGVPVIWLVAGVLLAVAELFTLDFVLIMLAGGALAAAATSLGTSSILAQVIVFAVVSGLGLLAVRPAIRKRLHRGAEPAVMGVEAIEGTEATVVERVADGRGLVKIGGELWTARPYDATQVIEPGELVRVVELKGATALVWKE
jgi:membrane protein implicated in regulation of membrane protease activity